MVTISYESHATTFDNENRVCSGFYDAELSDAGKTGAEALGVQYGGDAFAAIFCSDLQRAYKTAEIAFGNRIPIVQDARLRECDYGDFTHCTRDVMNEEQFKRITEPFPNGESYEQTMHRIGEFLGDLLRDYDGTRVMIIGHGATRTGLEHWLNGLSIENAMTEAKKDDPPREYVLKEMLTLDV